MFSVVIPCNKVFSVLFKACMVQLWLFCTRLQKQLLQTAWLGGEGPLFACGDERSGAALRVCPTLLGTLLAGTDGGNIPKHRYVTVLHALCNSLAVYWLSDLLHQLSVTSVIWKEIVFTGLLLDVVMLYIYACKTPPPPPSCMQVTVTSKTSCSSTWCKRCEARLKEQVLRNTTSMLKPALTRPEINLCHPISIVLVVLLPVWKVLRLLPGCS